MTQIKASNIASMTSAQLAGIVSDETGSGSLVFANNPYLSRMQVGDGSVTSPSIGFYTDGAQDTGFYHSGDGVISVACNAQTSGTFTTAGWTGNAGSATSVIGSIASAVTGTTQPVSDTSTKIATTAFVKSVGLNSSSWQGITSSQTLTSANMGGIVWWNSVSSGTLTLPNPATVQIGQIISLYNLASDYSGNTPAVCTIQHYGTEGIYASGVVSASSVTLYPSDGIMLVWQGNWIQVGANANSGLGYGQTWQAVTRTSGTTYYNTTNKPIVVIANYAGGTPNSSVNLLVNGLVVSQTAGSGWVYVWSLYGIVPSGSYYTFNTSILSASFLELR